MSSSIRQRAAHPAAPGSRGSGNFSSSDPTTSLRQQREHLQGRYSGESYSYHHNHYRATTTSVAAGGTTPTSATTANVSNTKTSSTRRRSPYRHEELSGERRSSSTTTTSIGIADLASISSSTMYPLHLQYPTHNDDDDGDDDRHHKLLDEHDHDNMVKIRTGKLLRAEKTRLEDYHVTYRTPLHVPDNAYQAYLQGRIGNSRRPVSFITRVCCLHTCIGFSVVAMIFLCFVGFLIETQPILMAGTLPKVIVEASDGSGRYSTRYLLPKDDEVLPAARTAYHAALAYFVCILLCLVALHPAWIQSQIYRVRHRYQEIPDHVSSADSTSPHIHNPNHHTSNATIDGAVTPNWAQTLWNRCNYIIRQRLAERGWYRPCAKSKKDRKTG